MIVKSIPARRLAMLAVASLFIAAPSFAKDHGNGKHDEENEQRHAEKRWEKDERHEARREHENIRPGTYFSERHRQAARAYYVQHYGHGDNCPPGLARKHNGCMPPGHARNWTVGRPLSRDVVVYEVPPPLIVELPSAPLGYRYARVGNDIVLLSLQTSVVVDIIFDLFH